MHIHILGICGTFMGSLALLARAMGHRVSGSDQGVYPPMSEQLAQEGIDVTEGYAPFKRRGGPDLVIIGNALSRGNAAVESVLNEGLPYTSGPEWLARNVLHKNGKDRRDKWVLAVAGTHGKTTTASILTWLLSHAGLKPGYLIGGVTKNLSRSAALGDSDFFVVEADEYDTAFFDKRSKFVHYRPRTLVLNNLEYDHGDIFPDLDAIKRQFHYMLRTVPGNGLVLYPHGDENLRQVLDMGCWSGRARLGVDVPEEQCHRLADEHGGFWNGRILDEAGFEVEITRYPGDDDAIQQIRFTWNMGGAHNVYNCVAAVAAAHHAGVDLDAAAAALQEFKGVRRRQELRGEVRGVRVYDDFAHHPTAIAAALRAMAAWIEATRNDADGAGGDRDTGSASGAENAPPTQRLIAVIDPRSNTMRSGVHQEVLADSCRAADMVLWHKPAGIELDIDTLVRRGGDRARAFGDVESIVRCLQAHCIPGDHVFIMSNGGFGGIHQKLLDALREDPESLPP